MRILLISPHFRWLGGAAEAVEHLAIEFRACGHTVAVLCPPEPAPEGWGRVPKRGVECVFAPIPPHKPTTWRHPERLLRRSAAMKQLVAAIRQWRPDIANLHIGAWDWLPVIANACRKAGVKLVHTFQGAPFGKVTEARLAALKHAAAITMVSAETKRLVEQLSPAARAATVIFNGVDLDAANAAAPLSRERPYVFCAARIYFPDKAIDVLISAFAEIASRYSDLDLLIAGDGPDREAARGLISTKGLEGRVQMLGRKRHNELWGYYKGATIFAMPSRLIEGTPLVFMEAMACGLPSIGTRIGGVPEIILEGETGLMIERNEPQELATAIGKLLDDSELRARMSERGRRFVQDYAWPQVARRYLEVFSACLEQADPRTIRRDAAVR